MKQLPRHPKTKRPVYLDHAAATPADPRVLSAMRPYHSTLFGNPSAVYSQGQAARQALESARRAVALELATQPDTIIFTGGGTEANNLALFGLTQEAAIRSRRKKPHLITSAVEHRSVIYPAEKLAAMGWEVTYLPVDREGRVDLKQLWQAIKPTTMLVSLMYANNEIGTVNPIGEIGRQILRSRQKNKTLFPFFHTDACQAAAWLDLSVERLHVDLMSLNGSKLYGPKGVGALYCRRGVPLTPHLLGGGQERGYRSGTENIAGIVGLAAALGLARQDGPRQAKRLCALTGYFWGRLLSLIPDISLNGPEVGATGSAGRLPNNLNVCFRGLEAEALVLYLDAYGIMAATGSAC